jgi:hypothetical protein
MQIHTYASLWKDIGKHSWKPFCEWIFRFSVTFFNYVSSITKASSLSVNKTGKNQIEPCQESMGDARVLLYCPFLRNP